MLTNYQPPILAIMKKPVEKVENYQYAFSAKTGHSKTIGRKTAPKMSFP